FNCAPNGFALARDAPPIFFPDEMRAKVGRETSAAENEADAAKLFNQEIARALEQIRIPLNQGIVIARCFREHILSRCRLSCRDREPPDGRQAARPIADS